MSLTWHEFEAALATTLPFLETTDTLVLHAGDPYPYMQLQQGPDTLVVEISSLRWLPADQRLSPETDAALATAGWAPPDPDHDNWHREESWPISMTTGAHIAAQIVHTLRDVLHVPAPGTLTHRAWRDSTRAPLDWPFLAELAPAPSPSPPPDGQG